MSSWSNFKTNNNLIVAQSEIPYISEVEGTAIIGTNSTITIKGFNFNPASEVICNAGIISNIQKDPEQISFDCLASSLGSFLVEVRNGSLSSLDWNSNYAPLLIARNALNLTNGWLDFRTVDMTALGVVTSHVNQGLTLKNFANSGYLQDATRGLIIGSTGTSTNNFIQFNSYPFPLNQTKFEIVCSVDTVFNLNGVLYAGRIPICVGDLTNPVVSNFPLFSFESYNNNWWVQTRYDSARLTTISQAPSNSLLINNIYLLKIVFDFYNQTVNIYKLNDLLNFESDSIVTENIPITGFKDSSYAFPVTGLPLFRFIQQNSPSSVIAMKIN